MEYADPNKNITLAEHVEMPNEAQEHKKLHTTQKKVNYSDDGADECTPMDAADPNKDMTLAEHVEMPNEAQEHKQLHTTQQEMDKKRVNYSDDGADECTPKDAADPNKDMTLAEHVEMPNKAQEHKQLHKTQQEMDKKRVALERSEHQAGALSEVSPPAKQAEPQYFNKYIMQVARNKKLLVLFNALDKLGVPYDRAEWDVFITMRGSGKIDYYYHHPFGSRPFRSILDAERALRASCEYQQQRQFRDPGAGPIEEQQPHKADGGSASFSSKRQSETSPEAGPAAKRAKMPETKNEDGRRVTAEVAAKKAARVSAAPSALAGLSRCLDEDTQNGEDAGLNQGNEVIRSGEGTLSSLDGEEHLRQSPADQQGLVSAQHSQGLHKQHPGNDQQQARKQRFTGQQGVHAPHHQSPQHSGPGQQLAALEQDELAAQAAAGLCFFAAQCRTASPPSLPSLHDGVFDEGQRDVHGGQAGHEHCKHSLNNPQARKMVLLNQAAGTQAQDVTSTLLVHCNGHEARLRMPMQGPDGRGCEVFFRGEWMSANKFGDRSGSKMKNWKKSFMVFTGLPQDKDGWVRMDAWLQRNSEVKAHPKDSKPLSAVQAARTFQDKLLDALDRLNVPYKQSDWSVTGVRRPSDFLKIDFTIHGPYGAAYRSIKQAERALLEATYGPRQGQSAQQSKAVQNFTAKLISALESLNVPYAQHEWTVEGTPGCIDPQKMDYEIHGPFGVTYRSIKEAQRALLECTSGQRHSENSQMASPPLSRADRTSRPDLLPAPTSQQSPPNAHGPSNAPAAAAAAAGVSIKQQAPFTGSNLGGCGADVSKDATQIHADAKEEVSEHLCEWRQKAEERWQEQEHKVKAAEEELRKAKIAQHEWTLSYNEAESALDAATRRCKQLQLEIEDKQHVLKETRERHVHRKNNLADQETFLEAARISTDPEMLQIQENHVQQLRVIVCKVEQELRDLNAGIAYRKNQLQEYQAAEEGAKAKMVEVFSL